MEDSGSTEETEARQSDAPDQEGDVDAMGRPKRRAVVGQGYGPTKARQIFLYLGVVALIIGAYFGAQYAISKLDVAPAQGKPQAPWAQPNAPQIPPQQFQ